MEQQRGRVYKVEVKEVRSGDDLVLLVDLGLDNLYKKVRARLLGVDTPDAYQADAATEAGKVRDEVRDITRRGKCSIMLHSQGPGGWKVTLLVHMTDNKSVDVNSALKAMGYTYKG